MTEQTPRNLQAPVLQGIDLTHSYGPTQVLNGVNIALSSGEVVALLGQSGSGKSTLLHLLGGLLRPTGGEVWLAGQRIDNLSERERSRARLRQIGFVFQFGDLVPELTVVENVDLPLRFAGTSPKLARTRALDLLDQLGVATEANRRLSEVSGGQAQRAAVARALVASPAVVLADEPTGALDSTTGERVLEALVGTAKEQDTAVLLVTHELRVASWADRDVLLRDGRVVGETPADLVAASSGGDSALGLGGVIS